MLADTAVNVSQNGGMVVDAVDQADRVVGKVPRSEVFAKQANFRVVHIFVFNGSGEVMIHRIAPGRLRHPGYWGSSVAGYVNSGETYDQAAARKLYAELGVSAKPTLAAKTMMNDSGCLKFICLYTLLHEGPFKIDRTQIAEIKYVRVRKVAQEIVNKTKRFTPTFRHVFDVYMSQKDD